MRDLSGLPKAHLHIHLEGAMRRATLEELASGYGLSPPADTRGQRFPNFGGFNALYQAACGCIGTRDDLERLIHEVAEDAAAEGALWIEPAFDAERYCERRAGAPDRLFDTQRDGWRFALECAARASVATGVGIGFVSAIDRTQPLEQARERMRITADLINAEEHMMPPGTLDLDERYAGIIAIGLHGNEEGFPPDAFAPVFEEALASTGLLSVPHAGEIAPFPGEGPASVKTAVERLNADRVLHGVLAVSDANLVADLARRGVCLDVCPSSNVALSVVDSLEAHPLPRLLAAGVPCTLGSDDPLLFGPSLGEEYQLCRDVMEIDDAMLAQMARWSFEHSGAPRQLKEKGLKAIVRWLEQAAA